MLELVIDKFSRVFSIIYKKKPNITSKDYKILEGFVNKHSNKGERWFIDLIDFTFEYYSSLNTQQNVQVNWVFGEKAVQRWERRGENWGYWVKVFRDKNGISEPEIPVEKVSEESKRQFRERERKRFFNTDKGFVHCQDLTLRKDLNCVCKYCNFKNICK